MSFCIFESKAQKIEILGENEIYLCDTILNNIHNKNNFINAIIDKQEKCFCRTTDSLSIFYNTYKEIFSLDRIKKFAQKNQSIILILYCDSSGNILEVDFLLRNICIPDITISEIEQLENAIKNRTLNLIHNCPDTQYSKFIFRCSFRDVLKDLSKNES